MTVESELSQSQVSQLKSLLELKIKQCEDKLGEVRLKGNRLNKPIEKNWDDGFYEGQRIAYENLLDSIEDLEESISFSPVTNQEPK